MLFFWNPYSWRYVEVIEVMLGCYFTISSLLLPCSRDIVSTYMGHIQADVGQDWSSGNKIKSTQYMIFRITRGWLLKDVSSDYGSDWAITDSFAESFLHVVWKIHWHLMFPKPCSSHFIIFIQGPGAFSVSIDHLEKLSASVCSCELISWQWCTRPDRHQDMWSTDQAFALKYRFRYRFPCPTLYKDCQVMPNNVFRWSNRHDGIEQWIWAMLLWSL